MEAITKITMMTYKELKATYNIDRNVLGKGSFGSLCADEVDFLNWDIGLIN